MKIMIGSAIEDKEGDSLSLSHFWEQAESCQDIESVVSREFGPLQRPPSFRTLDKSKEDSQIVLSKGKKKRGRRGTSKDQINEMDETLVTLYSLREVAQRGAVTTRVTVTGMMFAALCFASFAASTLILDTFQLRPVDISVKPPIIPNPVITSESSEMSTSHADSSGRFFDIKRKLMSVSDFTSETSLSPRVKALDWIANKDEMELGVDAPNLIQRYVFSPFEEKSKPQVVC